MDTDNRTDASYDSAGRPICDLCECLRGHSHDASLDQGAHLEIQAINTLCNSLNQLTATLAHELQQLSTSFMTIQRRLTDMEREQAILERRLQSTEMAYEAKSLLYDGTKLLLDKALEALERQRNLV
ncbi:uncharacterized protein LDX57_009336 [Aspergillus melleus]|uniref:uncharacterized protein n=1 Tax=Aspergillus melleus TaxID=138277 RepID=UPI001E8E08D5|nr:uncharacterized protein LDX57_009336 [Aspergillus melleus]KAH8431682.1 hypothetical protein LDX57_009336 [Aspergillus melleus]